MSARRASGSQPLKVLVDTNVWLDYFLARSKDHPLVCEFIARASEREDVALYVASLSLKDVAYLLASQMKLDVRRSGKEVTPNVAAAAREVAWACVRSVLDKAIVVPIGSREVLSAFACRRLHDDFEGDLMLGALDAVDDAVLMTHDAALSRHAGRSCVTAAEALALLA